MSLKLYLLQHGETKYSSTGIYCGEVDPVLTETGTLMAIAFASIYQVFPWKAVYASPTKRTMTTARPLCDAIGMGIQLRDGLKEISYGMWEGRTAEFVKQHYKEDYIRWLAEPVLNAPTGGETVAQVAKRALQVIAEIQQNYPSGNVLVVSHKATIQIILCSLLGIDLNYYRDRLEILTASVTIVRFDVRGPILEVLGDCSYMNSAQRTLVKHEAI